MFLGSTYTIEAVKRFLLVATLTALLTACPQKTGTIQGLVFEDANSNGIREQTEPGISGVGINWAYLSTTTNSSGEWTLSQVPVGSIQIVVTPLVGKFVSSANASQSINVIEDSTTQASPVGLESAAIVNGMLFEDINSNDLKDSNELGLAAWTIYDDANNNSSLEPGEIKTITASNGAYSINVKPGSGIHIRHVMNLGYTSSKAVSLKTSSVSTRIVGGQSAAAGAYPFMVAMIRASESDPNRGQFCGASLIAPHWVLTAAHCLVETENPNGVPTSLTLPANLDLMLGSNRLENPVTRIRALQVIVHPNYNGKTHDYDVALVKLSSNSSLETVQPLLPSETDLAATNTNARIIGWGDQADGANNYPIDLKEANVPIVDQLICSSNYSRVSETITPRMLCAGFPRGGIDTCQGDSGGPLLVQDTLLGIWKQAGVVSFGIGCATPRFPGVNTRLTEFNAYLEAQVGRGVSAVQNITAVSGQTLTGVSFAVHQNP